MTRKPIGMISTINTIWHPDLMNGSLLFLTNSNLSPEKNFAHETGTHHYKSELDEGINNLKFRCLTAVLLWKWEFRNRRQHFRTALHSVWRLFFLSSCNCEMRDRLFCRQSKNIEVDVNVFVLHAIVFRHQTITQRCFHTIPRFIQRSNKNCPQFSNRS